MKRKKIIWWSVGILALLIIVFGVFQGQKKEDIVILYTNDVHCEIEDNIGYAGLAAYRKEMQESYRYVALVDCGDAIQGDFIGTVSDGEYIVDIMNKLEYDFAVIGNHEFDYGMEQLSYLIEKAEAEYLACNITYTGKGQNAIEDVVPYEIVKYGNTKVAFIGVATPESTTKSTPSFFMEDGEFVYEFARGNEGKNLYECVQKSVDECRKKGADYVILLSHLGNSDEAEFYTSVDVIAETTGIDVVLDGHAHSTIQEQVELNKEGEEVILSSTGARLANIGKLVISEEGKISTELISDYVNKDDSMNQFIAEVQEKYEEEMNAVIAFSDIALPCTNENGVRMVRNRESTIGNMVADAYRIIGNADIGVVNGGGIRANLPAGDITYADMLAIHPFGNALCVVEATGSEILDLLENACRYTQAETEIDGNAVGEYGGFQQVSGLRFIIDTSVESSVIVDEEGNFVSVSGERRIKDVCVLNDNGEYEPLEEDKIYTVAGHNYLMKAGGDGFTGFMDNKFIIEEGVLDYQLLTTYISDYLEGSVGELYSEVEGRIVVK